MNDLASTAARPREFEPMFLLPYAVFIAHTLEELPGFAAWVERQFGSHSTDLFAAQHIPLVLFILLTGVMAGRRQRGPWMVLALAASCQFGINAVFHLGVWLVSGSYAPGAVTGATVSIPAAVFLLWWARHKGIATTGNIITAIGIGAAIAVAAISTLFIGS